MVRGGLTISDLGRAITEGVRDALRPQGFFLSGGGGGGGGIRPTPPPPLDLVCPPLEMT